MKGTEYLAARAAITAAGLAVGGLVVAGTALLVVPWIMRGLAVLAPNLLPPLGGVVVGLAMVVAVAVFMRHLLGYYLVMFERWVIEHGGVDD